MTSKVVSYKDLFSEYISAIDLQESKLVEQLHEEIGSDLMALKLKLSASDMIDEMKSDIDEKINALLLKIKDLTNQFYPTSLDELGLIGALKTYVRKCDQKHGVQVNLLDNNKSELCLSIDHQRQLYYIVEEILVKIIDNSVENTISLSIIQFDNDTELSISDKKYYSSDNPNERKLSE